MLFKPLWPVVDYVANYEYIVTVLCENKDRPELNCDGKCYLAKQFEKQQEESQKAPFSSTDKVEIPVVLFCQSDKDYQLDITIETLAQHQFPIIQNSYYKILIRVISPPPEVV